MHSANPNYCFYTRDVRGKNNQDLCSADATPQLELVCSLWQPTVSGMPKEQSAKGSQNPTGAWILAVPEPVDNPWCSKWSGWRTHKGHRFCFPENCEGTKDTNTTRQVLRISKHLGCWRESERPILRTHIDLVSPTLLSDQSECIVNNIFRSNDSFCETSGHLLPLNPDCESRQSILLRKRAV